jgi:two-component system cell cycle sensor histidine kinase/response regulator CckA
MQLAPEAKAREPARGTGQSILVVDDIENQRQIASDILEHIGYSVTTADSGEAAVAYLLRNTAEVVLLDMIMSP